jgi:hypothetical protein
MGQIENETPVYIECAKRDKLIVVDYQDAVRLCNIRFYENNNHIRTKRSNFHIAYLILEPEAGYDSHHINDDTYDNRRNNLMVKSHKGHSHLTNRKTGVMRHRRKWSVRIFHKTGCTSFGFEDRDVAERFVDWETYVRFGNEAKLNSPGHICSALAAYMIMQSREEIFVLFKRRNGHELRAMHCKYEKMDEESMGKLIRNQLLPVTLSASEAVVPNDSTLGCIPIENIRQLKIAGNVYRVSEI